MKYNTFAKFLPYIIAVVVFIIVAIMYCYPIIEGKVLNQPDIKQWEAMAHETKQFKEETGESTYWTNSMFSGMPTYQISMLTPANSVLAKLNYLFQLYLPSIIGIIMGYFIGFFILMRSFGVNKWLSIVGAIAIAFSSYFIIIIAAGHNTKAETLGFLAPVIGGFFLIFRKKYFWGVPLVMLYSCLGIVKHPQMAYYIFLMLGIFGIAETIIHIKEKRIKDLVVALLLFFVSAGIGLGTRYGVTKANSEYLKETMRGGHSELIHSENMELDNNNSGLSLKYATQWSYGIGETMTLIIPNFKGGATEFFDNNSETYKVITSKLRAKEISEDEANKLYSKSFQYWGNQPFTSGPVYIGAIVCFLFVLGIFLVKGPYKWALLVATIFSILLSWGHNFMFLTKFFFDYFPLYNKFRAVASILVVAEITMPLLGFLAVKSIMDGDISKDKIIKSIYVSFGITGGLCLIFALLGGSLLEFTGDADLQLPKWLIVELVNDRIPMLRADAFRSFAFILAGSTILWLYTNKKLKIGVFVIVLGIAIVLDMWPINRRFLGENHFITKRQNDSFFAKMPYEEQLLKDPDSNFRVLNLTTKTFNDSRTSYYLKSIGGYHGAKLRRYQDLIDEHISKNNFEVLNMLNTKYIITMGANGQHIAQYNERAMGNAWFVDTLKIVDNPDMESAALNEINFATTAVLDRKFENFANNNITREDSIASIELLSYAPNKLEYQSVSSIDKTAVFSEIYYPYGWKTYIDDEPVEHFRVNYVLRALNIPAGEHNIRFEFRPDAIYKGERVSFAFIVIMFLSVIFCIAYPVYRKRKNDIVKYKI
jgi:hypothetical protein